MWGKIRQDFRKFLPKQSMQNILYVIILTLTLLVAVFVGFFVSKSQQEKQAQIIVQDNQELAEQINVSMSQYLHSMMRLSDTLYYNIIKGNDRGQMEQMFQAMYDGYKDYVESIALIYQGRCASYTAQCFLLLIVYSYIICRFLRCYAGRMVFQCT